MKTKTCTFGGLFFAFSLSLCSQSSIQAQQENDDPNWRERKLEGLKKELEELKKEAEKQRKEIEELLRIGNGFPNSRFLDIYDYGLNPMSNSQFLHIYDHGPSPISNSRFLDIYDYGPIPETWAGRIILRWDQLREPQLFR
jgi:hypothetical protein